MKGALVLVLALSACGKKSATPEPPAEGEVAGVVLDVTGQATAAAPGGDSRALHPGSELVSGDVVATAEGASLRARLYHNRAVLVLGSGKMVPLRDSPAWKASPAAGSLLEGAPDDEGTSVAGRQAENEGADTRATGRQAETGAAPDTMPTPPKEPDPAKPDPQPTPPPDTKVESPKGGGGDPDDWGIIGETGSLGRTEVQKGMLELRQAIEKCWQQTQPGALEFSLRLRVSVRPDGTVKDVEVDEATGSPPAQVLRCVADAVKGGTFPRSKRGVTFTYPVAFKPAG